MEPSNAPVPHSVLDTRGMPGKQAFAFWQDHIGSQYDLRTPREFPKAFNARVDFWHLKSALLGTFQGPAQDWSRSRACIGRDGMDSFHLLVFRGGWSAPHGGGVPVGPGDILVCDMAQPLYMRGGDNELLTLVLPRHQLAPHLHAPDEHHLHLLRSADPLATLLKDHLSNLLGHLPNMSLEQARAAIPATVHLTAAALNGTIRDEQLGSVRMAMTERICRYIDARILDSGLSPESIARQFGMTRRNLGHLFEFSGGVAAYIRRKRLSLAHARLRRSARSGQSIEDIAQAHGFNHYRSFSLAYRKQFGTSPRETRAQALKGTALSKDADSRLSPWAHWLKDLK
ncbi:helix-turn-helix domain-containing protein [Mesorhizobium sp. CA14]|uniref:helix-turn-helix domain-containing protein n=1 Tax=Mesorhizobium sp. CA14 TaxID=2876642 RepID=UPI001CCF3705|nr:helix-turn-helix domain-containing protein [Mesorhizobium sp. CA14]MBZ9852028.1 helix-turn-helix domain-containing protein [Mesorhizobium sp. CA14]